MFLLKSCTSSAEATRRRRTRPGHFPSAQARPVPGPTLSGHTELSGDSEHRPNGQRTGTGCFHLLKRSSIHSVHGDNTYRGFFISPLARKGDFLAWDWMTERRGTEVCKQRAGKGFLISHEVSRRFNSKLSVFQLEVQRQRWFFVSSKDRNILTIRNVL